MKQLLNTLYILTPDTYLFLEKDVLPHNHKIRLPQACGRKPAFHKYVSYFPAVPSFRYAPAYAASSPQPYTHSPARLALMQAKNSVFYNIRTATAMTREIVLWTHPLKNSASPGTSFQLISSYGLHKKPISIPAGLAFRSISAV